MKKFNKKVLFTILGLDLLISGILYLVYVFTGNQYQPILYTYYALNVALFVGVLIVGICFSIKVSLLKNHDIKEKKK